LRLADLNLDLNEIFTNYSTHSKTLLFYNPLRNIGCGSGIHDRGSLILDPDKDIPDPVLAVIKPTDSGSATVVQNVGYRMRYISDVDRH
jgi:hypothetical protein